MAITKDEFVERLSEKSRITKKDCRKFLEDLDEITRSCLVGGDGVKLGFITLEPKDVQEKQAKNPKTGEAITVPAHRTVRVIVSSSLKSEMRKRA